MAKADEGTIAEVKSMLAAQLAIESRWYSIKHLISDADKDSIAVALASARDRLQFLADDFSN